MSGTALNSPIDLRSDTVTRPTAAMRAAMAAAPVGDDQYGDDPTANALQERVAALLGKEAALWLPSGTMANQVALRVFTRPGDDVIVSREAHAVWHETGGSAANAGVQLTEVGDAPPFTAAEFIAAIKPQGHGLYPPTTLVEIENTHNRLGGVMWPQQEVIAICDAARQRHIATFLDGARLWNVAAANGADLAQLANPFELVAVSFSKGLGAPGGSLLAGSRDLVAACVRHRRMLGGAMRQIGIYCAAAMHALDHHLWRLAEDHANAKLIAGRLAESARIVLDPKSVETNIVVFSLQGDGPDAHELVRRAREAGILLNALDTRKLRLVTHLDVSRDDCLSAADRLLSLAG